MNSVPVMPRDAYLTVVCADYERLMRCLKRNARIDLIAEEQISLAFVRENDQIRITQVSPASYELMTLCNGSRSILDISYKVSGVEGLPVSRQKASLFGVALLAQKGLIEVTNPA
jgi:hypothetical protein